MVLTGVSEWQQIDTSDTSSGNGKNPPTVVTFLSSSKPFTLSRITLNGTASCFLCTWMFGEHEKRSAENVGSGSLCDNQLALGAVLQVGEPLCMHPKGTEAQADEIYKEMWEDEPAMKGTPSSCAAVWWHVPGRPMKGTLYSFATPTTARASARSRAVIPYTAP